MNKNELTMSNIPEFFEKCVYVVMGIKGIKDDYRRGLRWSCHSEDNPSMSSWIIDFLKKYPDVPYIYCTNNIYYFTYEIIPERSDIMGVKVHNYPKHSLINVPYDNTVYEFNKKESNNPFKQIIADHFDEIRVLPLSHRCVIGGPGYHKNPISRVMLEAVQYFKQKFGFLKECEYIDYSIFPHLSLEKNIDEAWNTFSSPATISIATSFLYDRPSDFYMFDGDNDKIYFLYYDLTTLNKSISIQLHEWINPGCYKLLNTVVFEIPSDELWRIMPQSVEVTCTNDPAITATYNPEHGDTKSDVKHNTTKKTTNSISHRISKIIYYLNIAKTVSERGTCLRRNFGSVIVKDDVIVSTGYTGAPRGRINCCDRGKCFRMENNIPSGKFYEKCRSIHSEANAIINASKDEMKGSTLYLTGIERDGSITKNAEPCSMCKRLIINAGIDKVVVMTETGSKEFQVSDWILNDDSLDFNHEGY